MPTLLRRKTKKRRVYENVVFNLGGTAKVRRQKFHGQDHLVVPCVMMTEGVHNGSNGPGYYSEKETAKTAKAWDHMPIVVYHPQKDDGTGVSARDPDVLESASIGLVLNTRWRKQTKKLGCEAWINVRRANKVDKRIVASLERGEKVEVSTGLYLNRKKTKGEWNGEKYDWVATAQTPDHLAVLPDGEGACSIKDGAGLLQMNRAGRRQLVGPLRDRGLVENDAKAPSFSETTRQLTDLLAAKYGTPGKSWRGYVTEVFPDKVIFRTTWDYSSDSDNLQMQTYSVGKDGKVVLAGEAKAVTRVTEYKLTGNSRAYRTADGRLVLTSNGKGTRMLSVKKKARMATRLIVNSGGVWTAKDKPALMKMPDEQFKKVVRQAEAADRDDDEPTANATRVVVKKKVDAKDKRHKKMTLNAWKKTAPPQVLAMFNEAEKTTKRRKKALVDAITANESNPFAETWLAEQDVEVLEGMAVLANGNKADDEEDDGMFQAGRRPDFSGVVGGTPTNNRRRRDPDDDDDGDDEGLPLPKLFGDDEDEDSGKKKGKKKSA